MNWSANRTHETSSLTREEQAAWAKRISSIPERRAVIAHWKQLRGETEVEADAPRSGSGEARGSLRNPIDEADLRTLVQFLQRRATR